MSEVNFSTFGHVFSIPARYAEGQTINAAEAEALNSRRAEMISHKLRAFATGKGLSKGDTFVGKDDILAEALALVAKEAVEYEFGAGRGSTGPRVVLDPVSKKALELAEIEVRRAIAKSPDWKKVGKKDGSDAEEPGVYPWARFEATRAKVAEREEIVAAAKKAVAAESKASAGEVEL